MKIVVDAMGGDHAPAVVIEGVVEALNETDAKVALVGQQDRVEEELKRYSFDRARVEVIHADEIVEMHDPATTPIRKKKNSSIAIGIGLLKSEQYNAFISAGNTGAVVAASTIILGMIPGVERPAIGLVIPTIKGFAFLIDVGANTDPKPEHLLQSSLMAGVYAKEVLGRDKPRIGLLNIGEEASKGTDFVKTTHKLMTDHLPNFAGNIEPNAIFDGDFDCIICDGFAGNLVIKVSEGLMESATTVLKREIKKSPVSLLGALLMKSRLKQLKQYADYTEYGSAPLLGVNGIVMISHGRSDAKAIKNAIKAAKREIDHNIISRFKQEVIENQ